MSSHVQGEARARGVCEAAFKDASGGMRQLPWDKAASSVRFEELPPVAAFPVIPGKRWAPGWWWSATTGRHVVHGSAAMRSQLMLLDRDPDVVGLAGRPLRLVWRDGQGRVRSWVPQLFARYTGGTALLADCPSVPGGGGERARLAAQYVGAACAEVGWLYRRLEPLDPVLAANVRWLAGYRHPRNAGGPERMAAVQEAFRDPRPLIEGVRAVDDPMAVWPAVFHALWSGRLTVPLSQPLHERVIAHPGTSAAVAGGETR